MSRKEGGKPAFCLVTGQGGIRRTLRHGDQRCLGRAKLRRHTGFNLDAFTYNKEQGDNAPVSPLAAFVYPRRSSHLLDRNSIAHPVGDASTVFLGAERRCRDRGRFCHIRRADDPDAPGRTGARLARCRPIPGSSTVAGATSCFTSPGLAPNAARVSVRFWHAAPLHEIASQIRQWFVDLKVVRSPKDPEYPSLFRLLAACAPAGQGRQHSAQSGRRHHRAILSGSPFPCHLA